MEEGGGGQAGRQHGVDSCLQVCLVGGGKVGEDVHHTQQPGYLGQVHLPFPLLAGRDVVLEPNAEDPVGEDVGEAGKS